MQYIDRPIRYVFDLLSDLAGLGSDYPKTGAGIIAILVIGYILYAY